jgi:hypothetical protein
VRKLYEINAYLFLQYINHPDAAKFHGREDSAFVDVDEKDHTIHYNYEEHPDFEIGGAGFMENYEQVKRFVEEHGAQID